MARPSLTRNDCRCYYRSLPARAKANIRVAATRGPKGLLTTVVPWCLPVIGVMGGSAAGFVIALGARAAGLTFIEPESLRIIPLTIGPLVGFLLGGAGAFLLMRQVESAAVADFMREQMVSGGLATCPACDYDLRGTASPKCPECACPVRIGAGWHATQ